VPLATDVDITPAGQRPDEDPSLAARNNGGAGARPRRRAAAGGRRCWCSASAARRAPTTSCRSSRTSPGAAAPARAAARRRRALRALRRGQPDQRAEPGADRGDRARVRRRRPGPAVTGATELGALRRARLAAVGRRRHRARHVFPSRASRPGRAAGSTTRTWPGPLGAHRRGTRGGRRRRSCRTTSTPPASSAPTPTRSPPRWRGCPRSTGRPRGWSPRPTRIPDSMAAVAGPGGHAYEAELTAAARAVVDAVEPGRGSTWCGRAAAARRRCRGWSPTSTTTCARCTRTA
jgi:ferrochelatase